VAAEAPTLQNCSIVTNVGAESPSAQNNFMFELLPPAPDGASILSLLYCTVTADSFTGPSSPDSYKGVSLVRLDGLKSVKVNLFSTPGC
jgi:hypothetical protein